MRTVKPAPACLGDDARDLDGEETAGWFHRTVRAQHAPVLDPRSSRLVCGAGRPAVRHGLPALSVFVVLSALLLGACGGSSQTATSDSMPESSGSTSMEPAGVDNAYPVTIEHKFGATEITEEPQRVLSLGFQEHDTIFALGVEPIAVRYWYGDEDDVIFPWAEEAAGDADPEILNMPELNFEKIAALDPDLILGLYAGITEEDYPKLAAIAPTVPQSDEYVDYGVPWQEATRTIGTALGRSERAEELVAEVEGQFEAVREAHPEWSGKSIVVATYGADDLSAFTSQDLRSRFFTSLGFEVPAKFDELAGELFYATFSYEQAELLEVDVLVWDQVNFTEGGRATIEADPLLQQLDVVQEGRTVFIGELEDAFAWNSVLSLPVALDGLVPMLERATDGDPTTEPSPAS
ncbi:MAG: iron-siderophore ABC transporter substrate-binding protein [Actinomycetota bacterium]|nr:iron-siderophore ABC transporter substrate-binding protein [Actinomycetota bacterium]